MDCRSVRNAAFIAVLLAWGAGAAIAQNSFVLNGSNSLSVSDPATPIGSFRIEFRIQNPTPGLTGFNTAPLMELPAGFLMRFMGPSYNGPISFQDLQDTFAAGQANAIYFDTTGRTDILLRIQRDTAKRIWEAEMWNGDGSGYQFASLSIQTIQPIPLPWTASVGGAGASFSLTYLRLYGTLLPPGIMPFGQPYGGLLSVAFNSSITNDRRAALAVIPSGRLSLSAAPTYRPYVSQGPQRTLVGSTALLDGTQSYPLNNATGPLAYEWAQISGPTTLTWSSPSAVQPLVSGLAFGSYVISLRVTDSSGASSMATLKYGAVAVDASGHVAPPESWITTVFGPMLPWGVNPWPYFETQQKELADFFGALQSTEYVDVWNTAARGAVSVSNGSATVSGAGTTFRSTFCNGGSTAYNGAAIVLWYPVTGSPGRLGRRAYSVATCESDTSLALTRPYDISPSAQDLNYTAMDNASIGTWINGSTNANYYDNVLAFYNLYYRSGIDDYLTYARVLADRWWTMPWIDEGRDCSDGDGATCLFPRLQSVTGLLVRALDGRPDMWPGLRALIAYDYGFADVTKMTDLREDAYATAFVALAAGLDPDRSSQQVWKANVVHLLETLWLPNVQPDGSWLSPSYGYASWNGYPGTISVVKGSTAVTGSGTDWQASWFTGNAFWTADPDMSNGDGISYTATYVSPTQLTLNMPYQGSTASGRGWQASNLVGFGTQPFMMGTAGAALRFAFLATGDLRIPPLILGISNWLSTEGYRPDARGLWYGRKFANCEPIAATNAACSGGTVEQSRFLAGEIMSVLTYAFTLSQSLDTLAFTNNIYSAMYDAAGGPEADTTYITDIANGGWAMQTQSAKDFGFFFGFGFGSQWPAATFHAPAAAPVQ